MSGGDLKRRLVAILAADVAGYSRLMAADESATVAALDAARAVFRAQIETRQGRVIDMAGDSVLAVFETAIGAVSAALAIQQHLAGLSADVPDDRRMRFRIGVHLGDVIEKADGTVYGDGVNVAARLEGLAEPGGITVSESIRTAVKGRVTARFDDQGAQQVKNIADSVRAYRVSGEVGGTLAVPVVVERFSRTVGAIDLSLPDKPSIAVLPFANMSGDPEQEYFADGIAEDIITALSRFKSLFVIARNSSFSYRGRSVDIRQVGKELGVRYVLEGSVRKAGGRVRITGQLIDSATGGHLWAERFDGSLEAVFELQDQVTASVVGAIAPKIDQAEMERAKRKPVDSLDAYDCFLRGMARINESIRQALGLFQRAIELAPDFATPYGMAARCSLYRLAVGRVDDIEREKVETRRLAQRVSAIGQDDALALTWAGLALVEVCRDYDTGEAMIDRALSINANLAVGWTNRGTASVWLGQHETAIEQASRAFRLSPVDPEAYRTEVAIAVARLFQGRHEDALDWARRAFAHSPGTSSIRVLMTLNALAGNVDEARNLAAELRRLVPAASVSYFRTSDAFRRPQDSELFVKGYRIAGLPE